VWPCVWCNCSPYVIGTMNQSTSASVANLQLHHNFRWVLYSPHTEPVRGFLFRYLRRRLISTELHTGLRDGQLERIVSWLPAVLERVNKFLESQSSTDLTLGGPTCYMYSLSVRTTHTACTDFSVGKLKCRFLGRMQEMWTIAIDDLSVCPSETALRIDIQFGVETPKKQSSHHQGERRQYNAAGHRVTLASCLTNLRADQ